MANRTSIEFTKLQKSYGLHTPRQIKARIIWNHLISLTLATFGNSADTRQRLSRYDLHFRTAEAEELSTIIPKIKLQRSTSQVRRSR